MPARHGRRSEHHCTDRSLFNTCCYWPIGQYLGPDNRFITADRLLQFVDSTRTGCQAKYPVIGLHLPAAAIRGGSGVPDSRTNACS
ncbi:hypothetical protein GCK32_002218 [Trichostrongylus colubriformis]|uniref:Uncharacterized protein n=1 Tax=Trichostrongylus colubriformis TaxID=6319 RepID=A0AAN8ISZ0_TRICO